MLFKVAVFFSKASRRWSYLQFRDSSDRNPYLRTRMALDIKRDRFVRFYHLMYRTSSRKYSRRFRPRTLGNPEIYEGINRLPVRSFGGSLRFSGRQELRFQRGEKIH